MTYECERCGYRPKEKIRFFSRDGFTFNMDKFEVGCNDEILKLTPSEFKILWKLVNTNYLVTVEQLLFYIESEASNNDVSVHICRIRKKFKKAYGHNPIKTVKYSGLLWEQPLVHFRQFKTVDKKKKAGALCRFFEVNATTSPDKAKVDCLDCLERMK